MEIIPKPSLVSRRITAIGQGFSLAHQMKLTGSRADLTLYFDIVNTVAFLCDRYLPYHRDMRPTDKQDAKSTLIQEAKRRYTRLECYEDDWPLKVMIVQHRQLRRSGGKGLSRSAHEIETMKQNITYRQVPGARGKSKPRKPSNTNTARSASRVRSTSQGSTSAQGSPKENIPASKLRSSTLETIPVATMVSEKQPLEAVLQFLRNLAQNLSFLLPVFVRYGVTDRTSLRSIPCMENWRAWIYTWVKEGHLTELQFKMVTDGMGRIV